MKRYLKKILLLPTVTKIWFVFIVLAGLILTLLVPPLQKPDEYEHFHKAVTVSNGLFSCKFQDQAKSQLKYNEIPLLVDKYKVTQNYKGKFYHGEYLKPIFSTEGQENIRSDELKNECYFPSISYTFQSIGLIFANILNLNGIVSFYLGRFIPLLVFLLVLLWSLSRSSLISQKVLLLYASIPVAIQQVGSYSYDSIQIIIGIFLAYYLMQLLELKRVSINQFIIYASTLLLLHFTKPNSYLFLFFTPLLFIDKLFIKNNTKKVILVLVMFFTSVILLFISPYLKTSQSVSSGNSVTPITLQRELLFSNPVNIYWMIYNTLEKEFMFYVNSLIGNLGWLDYQLGSSVIIGYLLLACYVAYQYEIKQKIRYVEIKILVILSVLFGSFLLIVTMMYLYHTPTYFEIGGLISSGGQGRYFLLLLPLFIILSGLLKQSKVIKYVLMTFTLIFFLFKIGQAVYFRYYDYQSLYDIPNIEGLATGDINDVDVLILDEMIELELVIQPEKQLKGFTIGPIVVDKGLLFPYSYKLYNSECGIEMNVISNNLITSGNISNDQIVVLFNRPINENDEIKPLLCIELFPYPTNLDVDDEFVYMKHNKKLTISPIYLNN